jgi:hypothetical protein
MVPQQKAERPVRTEVTQRQTSFSPTDSAHRGHCSVQFRTIPRVKRGNFLYGAATGTSRGSPRQELGAR